MSLDETKHIQERDMGISIPLCLWMIEFSTVNKIQNMICKILEKKRRKNQKPITIHPRDKRTFEMERA